MPQTPAGPAAAEAATRQAAWEHALGAGELPEFVVRRLHDAAQGRAPWMSTMTPAELRLARSHGVRPLAAVSGTCWYQYGRSWTEGHAAGWRAALQRLRAEAIACGANAVVDVKMRTVHTDLGPSMDYTLLGTAVRMDGLPPSPDPVVATVSALEFVRLLEMGVVPCGLAVGAQYEWLTYYTNLNITGAYSWTNQELGDLTQFWQRVRRQAHQELRADAARQGTGVLAHTQFGQLFRQERDRQAPAFLGRHIVIGTVVDTRPGDAVPHHIRTVVDMRDELSPLLGHTGGPSAYDLHDREGAL